MAIAADDGLSRLRDAKLRPNDVHDTLMLAVHVKEAHAGFAAIFLERFKLEAGVGVNYGQSAIFGGDGEVHHREGEIGAADFASFGAQAGTCLRGSGGVHEVAVNLGGG